LVVKKLDDLVGFCRKTGFVFPSAEIYGGYSGFWDYGPNGVELKNKIKQVWWRSFVSSREDVVGVDGSIITHPLVWKASGHVDNFIDPLVECSKCGKRWRADHLVADALKINTDGLSIEALNNLIKENELKCPSCKKALRDCVVFNLMFKTYVGPVVSEKNAAFLRPETAQLVFTNFKPVLDSTRLKLPFGIAQIGKAFRNEISPRNYFFRAREFEQMEIEFFTNPKKKNKVPKGLLDEFKKMKINVLTARAQEKRQTHKKMSFDSLLEFFKNRWHAYWVLKTYSWFVSLGLSPDRLRLREHLKDELSHYSATTWDVEYYYPFGWKELSGVAMRGQFDLKQHEKYSRKKLRYFDQESGESFIPYVVAEPSSGVDRALMAFLCEAYTEEKERIVLKLHPLLAPVQVAVFPLVKKREEFVAKAREVFNHLKNDFTCFYDAEGSIGRRYRRQDAIGTPLCVTIDDQTMQDDTVTIRERDSMKQVRVKTIDLKQRINDFFKGVGLKELGELVD